MSRNVNMDYILMLNSVDEFEPILRQHPELFTQAVRADVPPLLQSARKSLQARANLNSEEYRVVYFALFYSSERIVDQLRSPFYSAEARIDMRLQRDSILRVMANIRAMLAKAGVPILE